MKITHSLGVLIASAALALSAAGQQITAPAPQAGTVNGTVIDVNGDIVPGAIVVLDDSVPADRRAVAANDNGFFTVAGLRPATPWRLTVSAPGFADWVAPPVTLTPGQFVYLTNIQLKLAQVVTTVNAIVSPEEIATEQVHAEEKQRVAGFIPNFYVVYDPNAAPLTARLKFQLALRTAIDPVTIAGVALVSATDQAGDVPNFQEGAEGYGQRVGANYLNGFTDIMIGGALLPSLLHQDPRYFYQGTGTKKSRILHAISSPIVTRGDNGRPEPNISSIGGDLASAAIANSYYPASNRGPELLLSTALINAGARMTNGLIQEFVLRGITTGSRDHGAFAQAEPQP